MSNLWPDFDLNVVEENNALVILEEQAKVLENKTEGKVKATFSKIEYQNENPFRRLNFKFNFDEEEILDENLKGKKLATEFLSKTDYKFEIYRAC